MPLHGTSGEDFSSVPALPCAPGLRQGVPRLLLCAKVTLAMEFGSCPESHQGLGCSRKGSSQTQELPWIFVQSPSCLSISAHRPVPNHKTFPVFVELC